MARYKPKWELDSEKAMRLIAEARRIEEGVEYPEDRSFPQAAIDASEKAIRSLLRKLKEHGK